MEDASPPLATGNALGLSWTGAYLYAPTMLGMVYVQRWNAETLDKSALVSLSDLGPAGKTWSLSSLAYSDGRLYARTLKELICIGR